MKTLIMTALFVALVPVTASSQPRASERGSVTQIVNGTTLTLDFARPVARGRDPIFGGVVHWGEMWTPGANWATTFETDRPVRLDGHPVPAGRYSVWMEPGPDRWRVHLNRTWRLYHDTPVPADEELLAFDAIPAEGAHMESLAWYFPAVDGGNAELRMHWGTTFVPMRVETDPFSWTDPPPTEASTYLGAYAFDTRDPTTGGPMQVTITLEQRDGRLAARWGRAPIALIPVAPGEFRIGFMRNGELFDVGDEMTLRIAVADGRSTGAALLWEGEVFAEALKEVP